MTTPMSREKQQLLLQRIIANSESLSSAPLAYCISTLWIDEWRAHLEDPSSSDFASLDNSDLLGDEPNTVLPNLQEVQNYYVVSLRDYARLIECYKPVKRSHHVSRTTNGTDYVFSINPPSAQALADELEQAGSLDNDLDSPESALKESRRERIMRIQRDGYDKNEKPQTDSSSQPICIDYPSSTTSTTSSFPPTTSLPPPPPPYSAGSTSIASAGSSYKFTPPRVKSTQVIGAVGLSNLGNTCFMNSALQCLSNTPLLTSYFISGKWTGELNRDNPLGMKGEVADAYANLISQLWSPDPYRPTSVPPRDFKSTIGRFNSMFVGYSQQDSQELLQFLLDGLHEDLNRIREKPYVELPDMDGQPDQVIADKSWECYRLRNNSEIVDLFQGEYKSLLQCTVCHKTATKFDPYMFLSLPVPDRREVVVRAIVLARNPKEQTPFGRPQRHVFTLPRDSTIVRLKKAAADFYGWGDSVNQIQVVELFGNKIWGIFLDTDPISQLVHNDTVCVVCTGSPDYKRFELEPDADADGHSTLPVYFHELMPKYMYGSSLGDVFGIPSFVTLPSNIKVQIRDDGASKALDEAKHNEEVTKAAGALIYTEVVETIAIYSALPLFRRIGSDITLDMVYEAYSATDAADDTEAEDNDHPVRRDCSRTLQEGFEPLPNLFSLTLSHEKQNRYSRPGSHYDSFYRSDYSSTHSSVKIKLYECEKPAPVTPAIHANHATPVGPVSPVSPVADDEYTPAAAESSPKEPRTDDAVEDGDANMSIDPSSQVEPDEPIDATTDAVAEVPAETSVPDVEMGTVGSTEPRFIKGIYVLPKLPSVLVMEWPKNHIRMVFKDERPRKMEGAFKPNETQEYTDYVEEERAYKKKRQQSSLTLQECLNEFSKEELLSEDDTWYCPNCKQHQHSKKKLDIWSVPEVLVFHLKRFSNSARSTYRSMSDKIDAHVEFPVHGLDLTNYVIGRQREANGSLLEKGHILYDLYAVSNHFGGLGGGHYTAYAKNIIDGEWYNFDDSRVSRASESEVVSSAAYLLFYVRRESRSKSAREHIIERLKDIEAKLAEQPPPAASSYRPYENNAHISYRTPGIISLKSDRLADSRSGHPSPLATLNNTPARLSPASSVNDVREHDTTEVGSTTSMVHQVPTGGVGYDFGSGYLRAETDDKMDTDLDATSDTNADVDADHDTQADSDAVADEQLEHIFQAERATKEARLSEKDRLSGLDHLDGDSDQDADDIGREC
ncbi:uncharacterized protein BJ171DRAFT_567881 [Polychytrium aggregatum]|uniref:uncharacterized protein n=1 Tax=Polychytrium aggregatum TaxID=110093 RepID=UPI0022FEB1E9|nr:uncharacterized protein BJ171DRAFT_567881 [Polychytrium aggregatum]KAI9204854.1 hypothetical protein BJ171DRAFT_567881 [Polychytrium aggregatum]